MDHISFAKQIAKEVGQLILERKSSHFSIKEKTSKFDLVTDIDKLAEEFIKSKIMLQFPEHKIIGEEENSFFDNLFLIEEVDKYLWVIDPIDGTTNFIHGLPGYTVSIALLYNKEIVLGVVYDPNLDELFWAEKGKGAYRNEEKIKASTITEIGKSVLSTGYPSDISGSRTKVIDGINNLGLVCNNIRTFGSAALHLSYVAAGRLEGFWEYGLNIWDVAAGYLLVKEANGEVTDISGDPFSLNTKNILASNGKINNEFCSLLNRA